MQQADKLKYLTIALYVFGLIYLIGVPVLMMGLEAPGWTWTPRQPEYEQMIMGVYATLGVFLIMAAKKSPAARQPDLVHCLVEYRAWRDHVRSRHHR